MTDRKATNIWEGDLKSGSGRTSFDSSGALAPVEVSWDARAGEPGGQTSPEELIAAAHVSCFNMKLAGELAQKDAVAERVETNAVVTFSTQPTAHVSKVALHVRASVPDLAAEDFLEAATNAKDGCPVSKLIAGNTEITLDAALT